MRVLETDTPSGCEADSHSKFQSGPARRSVPKTPARILVSEIRILREPHAASAGIARAIFRTLRTSWFWCSIASALCWTAWAFTARLGSKEIPPATMQFISAFGFLLVALVPVVSRKVQFNKDLRANGCALHRPDGNWSLMLVNRDETSPHTVRVVFEDSRRKHNASLSGPVTLVTFGSEQYVWKNDGLNSHADPDSPPIASAIVASSQSTFTLPQASITILRGKVEGPGD